MAFYHSTFLLAACLLAVFRSSPGCTAASFSGNLTWIPNNEGVFSQYLQMKVMHFVAFDMGASNLFIPHQKIAHMNRTVLNLCDVFRLQRPIKCTRVIGARIGRPATRIIQSAYAQEGYITRHETLKREYENDTRLSFRFTVPFIGGETRRDALIRAISFSNPPLVFHRQYVKWFRQVKTSLLQKLKPELKVGPSGSVHYRSDINYTVVHWRRGDQLQSRCKQGKDISANCRNASELLQLIRLYSSDTLVYIATNEHMASPEISYLRKHGCFVFADGSTSSNAKISTTVGTSIPINPNYTSTSTTDLLYTNSTLYTVGASIIKSSSTEEVEAEQPTMAHNSVAAFVVDVRLMLDATTFLGFGVSIINDVVEHERMLRNKTWCTTTFTTPPLSAANTSPTAAATSTAVVGGVGAGADRAAATTYPTWCWLQEQLLLQIQAHTLYMPKSGFEERSRAYNASHDPPTNMPNTSHLLGHREAAMGMFPRGSAALQRMRNEIARAHDANMTQTPLVLSAYDVSGMPAYQKEVRYHARQKELLLEHQRDKRQQVKDGIESNTTDSGNATSMVTNTTELSNATAAAAFSGRISRSTLMNNTGKSIP